MVCAASITFIVVRTTWHHLLTVRMLMVTITTVSSINSLLLHQNTDDHRISIKLGTSDYIGTVILVKLPFRV